MQCTDNIIANISNIVGPEDHFNVMQEISSNGLLRPTSTQLILALAQALPNEDNPVCMDINDKFINHYLWSATEHILIPVWGGNSNI